MTTIDSIKTTHTATHSPQQRGVHITKMEHSGVCELHITIIPEPGEHLGTVLHRLAKTLKEHKAQVVKQQVFAAAAARAEGLRLISLIMGDVNWPVTWVESGSEFHTPIAGMHVLAIAGAVVKKITSGNKTIGTIFEDRYIRHLLLGDVTSSDAFETEAIEARQVYETLETTLKRSGMGLTNVARTWFFLTDILTWYDSFNKVRNLVYHDANPRPPFLPASTGVGIPSRGNGALLVEAYATQALDPRVVIRPVLSPLQCAATNYGSSFCRALEIATPETRRITISGTASIDPAGRTMHVGDMALQVDQTMRVVGGILASQKLTWSDVSRATAYFKDISELPVFTAWCDDHQLRSLPVIHTQADVCRDDLLFEIELDAIC